MRGLRWVAVVILFAAMVTATAPAQGAGLTVFVSVMPQKFLVERVGGELVKVEVLVGPGQSPATLDPTARQMVKLSKADVYFGTGVPFERVLLEKLSRTHTGLKIVDTLAGIDLVSAEGHGHGEGPSQDKPDHDTEDSHSNELDPHVWMSPKLAAIQAATIARALAEADPANASIFQDNLNALVVELNRLDESIRDKLSGVRGGAFFVFHPAYGYFAREYGLTQIAVETDGKEPGARSLAELTGRFRDLGAKVIFVQPQFSKAGAEAIARMVGAEVIEMDSLAGDYIDNMNRIATVLAGQLVEGEAR